MLVISTVSWGNAVETLDSRGTAVHIPDLTFSQYPPSLNFWRISVAEMRSKGRGFGLESDDMITVPEIREHIVGLLAIEADKENALSAFEDWLVQASWDMHKTSSRQAQQFVAEIELNLAEHETDYDLLWKQLKNLLRIHQFSMSAEEVRFTTGSSGSFKLQEWAFLSAGKQPAVASS